MNLKKRKKETFVKKRAWQPKNDTTYYSYRSISHFSPFESWLCLCSLNVRTYFGVWIPTKTSSTLLWLVPLSSNEVFLEGIFYQAAQDSQHVNMPEANDNFEVVEVLLVGKGYDKVLWPPGWQVKDHKKKICGFCIYLWEEEVKSNPVEFFLSWLPPIHLIFSTRHSMVSIYIGQSHEHNFGLSLPNRVTSVIIRGTQCPLYHGLCWLKIKDLVFQSWLHNWPQIMSENWS